MSVDLEGTDWESFANAVGMVIAVVAKYGVSDPDRLETALEALHERVQLGREADRDFVAEAVQMISGGVYTGLNRA